MLTNNSYFIGNLYHLIIYSSNVHIIMKSVYSLGQLTSHYWPSFGKGENKASILLWYSCFDRSILIFLMHEGLQSRIIILKHCLTRLRIDISQLTFVFPFAETRSVDVNWPREFTATVYRQPLLRIRPPCTQLTCVRDTAAVYHYY